MSFLTLNFLLFLVIVVGIFWSVNAKYRKIWILFAGYFFYGFSDARMLIILLAVTVNVWMFGKILIKVKGKVQKWFYILGFVSCILILGYFKYLNFFSTNINKLFEIFHISVHTNSKTVLLPLGLSFIIFQATTYLGDVYHGKWNKTDFLSVACFVSFFPTILSGPIQKANKLMTQLEFSTCFNREKLIHGILLLGFGYFEKIFVADRLASIINPVYDNYQNYSAVFYVFAMALYSIQIYADFMAYSDIAIGIASMLGVSLSRNFHNPYLSENLVDFWRNWHISLNEWFVEYIYIPLGGSKKGALRKYINTFIVFFLSGLWHGAQWTFVIWGALNGLLQIIGQMTKKLRERLFYIFIKEKSIVLTWCRRFIVFVIISFTWLFFRIPTLETTLAILKKIGNQNWIFIFDKAGWSIFGTTQTAIVTVISLMVFFILQMQRREEGKIINVFWAEPGYIQKVVLAIAWVIILINLCQQFTNPNSTFIYFKF